MNTPTTAQPGPFRLVSDPFWISTFRDHFGRTPTRLADLQICHEELRYRRRIAELKALAPKLALLDEVLPDLAKLGIDLSRRDVLLRKQDGIGVVLRYVPEIFMRRDDKLRAALIAVGFREIERKQMRDDAQVILKHGRALHIMLDVSPEALPKADGAPASEAAPAGVPPATHS